MSSHYMCCIIWIVNIDHSLVLHIIGSRASKILEQVYPVVNDWRFEYFIYEK